MLCHDEVEPSEFFRSLNSVRDLATHMPKEGLDELEEQHVLRRCPF